MKKLNYDMIRKHSHEAEEDASPSTDPCELKPIEISQGMVLTFDSTQFHLNEKIDIEKNECSNIYCLVQTDDLYQAKFSNLKIYFCKDCFKLYQMRNCCYFCAQVYSDDHQTFLDGKRWIQCDEKICSKWMHIDCESKYGLKQIIYLSKKTNYIYKCPWCRQKKEQILKSRENTSQKEYLCRQIENEPDDTKEEVIIFKKKSNHSDSHTRSCDTKNFQTYEPSLVKKQKFEPIMRKNTYLDDLLKKYGGFTTYVSVDDTISDLVKINSIITNKEERGSIQ